MFDIIYRKYSDKTIIQARIAIRRENYVFRTALM